MPYSRAGTPFSLVDPLGCHLSLVVVGAAHGLCQVVRATEATTFVQVQVAAIPFGAKLAVTMRDRISLLYKNGRAPTLQGARRNHGSHVLAWTFLCTAGPPRLGKQVRRIGRGRLRGRHARPGHANRYCPTSAGGAKAVSGSRWL